MISVVWTGNYGFLISQRIIMSVIMVTIILLHLLPLHYIIDIARDQSTKFVYNLIEFP
jgi:hypothetical protein